MAVTPVYVGNEYVETLEEKYAELQADFRDEIQSYPTAGYTIGSKILCAEDLSLWTLVNSTSGREWKELDI